MERPEQAQSVEYAEGMPPFWTRTGYREPFGGINGRVAILDVHSPLCLRGNQDLTGGGGIEDLEKLADRALDAGFIGIQLNPVNDTGWSPCSYCATGLFSYDPAFVSLHRIPELEDSLSFSLLSTQKQQDVAQTNPERFDHNAIRSHKLISLAIGYERLGMNPSYQTRRELFEEFCEHMNPHVLNYVVFTALHDHYGKPWWEWPDPERRGNAKAIFKKHQRKHDTLFTHMHFLMYTQCIAEEQWTALARHIEDRGGYLVMDKAIYPQHNSADVWANQHLFYLKEDGNLLYASGCASPGDPHGAQEWGHAVYKFNEDPKTTGAVIEFFVDTVRHISKTAKVIRLDHALALVWKYYVIDRQHRGNSHHIPALKHQLLQRLRMEFPDVTFIAEDLGLRSEEEVNKPLRENGISGMRAPIWSFGPGDAYQGDTNSYPHFCVGLTDNHDTPSPHQWYGDGALAHVASVFWSKAHITMTTLRTVQGDPRRYNLPGVVSEENWSARSNEVVEHVNFGPIARIIEETGRNARRLLSSGPILSSTPLMGEQQWRKPGETFTLRIALTPQAQLKHMHVFTNGPISGKRGGTWQTLNLEEKDPHLSWQSYRDGTRICTIDLPITTDAHHGSYEVAAHCFFANGTSSPLCLPGQNMVLIIENP